MLGQTGNGGARALRALAAAAIVAFLSTPPALAQFDFLFGLRPESKPPPAQAAPSEPAAGPAQHGKVKRRKGKPKKMATAKPEAGAKAPLAEVEEPPPPYGQQLLKLAEILGALTYLDELCEAGSSGEWRAKMQLLLDAEGKTKARKEQLAGTYNRGFRDYERNYRFCTPNARAIVGRFLAEGGKLARDVVNRYGGT